jgi:hypothetical protein
MSKKTSKIEFKLEDKLFMEYKSLCVSQGYDMSKRLRIFIEKELEYNLRGECIIQKINS